MVLPAEVTSDDEIWFVVPKQGCGAIARSMRALRITRVTQRPSDLLHPLDARPHNLAAPFIEKSLTEQLATTESRKRCRILHLQEIWKTRARQRFEIEDEVGAELTVRLAGERFQRGQALFQQVDLFCLFLATCVFPLEFVQQHRRECLILNRLDLPIRVTHD